MPLSFPRLWSRAGRPVAGPDDLAAETALRPVDEPRLPLHVLADDAELSIEDGQLVVEAAEARRLLRLDELSQVALHGGARVTVPALHALSRAGVPLVFHSRSGHYIGQTLDLTGATAAVRRAQYRAAEDPSARLAVACDLIGAKLAATERLARRQLGAKAPVVRALARARGEAAKARSEASLRGIEGAAAAAWYGAWTEFLTRDDPVFVFDGRSRRPPKDGVNALLSYLYAVLAGSAAGAAAAAGLDPAVGFLHGERPGRPALALDLAEPFRVAVVDAAVIAALNEGQFGEADVTPPGEDGVRLTDQGRRRALAVLERRLSTAFRDGTQDVTWRGAVAATAQRLGAALRGGRAGCAVPLPAA